ncbi:MAG: sugar phosphate isomerase/epimerase, partial [Planctomycetia bacterium]
MSFRRILAGAFVCSLAAMTGSARIGLAAEPVDVAARANALFRRDNLVAWCIVPFDAKKRGPEERAAMLEKLGFK